MSEESNLINPPPDPDPLPWVFEGKTPDGDNPDVTVHLTEATVHKLSTTMREIVDMVEVFEDMAPRTATCIWELLSVTSAELLLWTRRWQA
ncbi:hypothetical protein OG225_16760 [Nocardia sp. NBC_01377]|uniref:hypothetical protein n=1 Tax=Nocardia sp. NBC_01377 TaxID=2903595 RepID=UPI0032508CDA